MVDLGAYVLLLVETKDKKIKLYGSPADKSNLEIGDEVLEINGKSLEDCTHDEAISYIHECIKSKTICLKVKRKSDTDDIDPLTDITDAYAIAVETKAKERLERLAAKHNFSPLDMTKFVNNNHQQPANTLTPGFDSKQPSAVPDTPDTYSPKPGADARNIDLSPPVYDSYYETTAIGRSGRRKSSSSSLLGNRRKSSVITTPTVAMTTVAMTPTDGDGSATAARLKKYGEEVGRRDEEREAAQRERDFLRSSLRGSQRLQALEEPTTPQADDEGGGHANPAFSPSPPTSPSKFRRADSGSETAPPHGPKSPPASTLDIESVLRKMDEMLKLAAHPTSSTGQVSLTREDMANIGAVRDLLQDPGFKDSFDIYNTTNKCLRQGMLLGKNPLPDSSSSTDSPSLLQLASEVSHQLNITPGSSYIIPIPGDQNRDSEIKISDLSNLLHDSKIANLFTTYDEVSSLFAPDILRYKGSVNGSPTRNSGARLPYRSDTMSVGVVDSISPTHHKYLDRTFQYPENNIKIVKIEKGPDPLGATIRNEGDSVVVARIVRNGSAEKTGLLREGDEILEVNGVEMRGKSVNEVCNLLANLTGTLTFVVVPNRGIDTGSDHPTFAEDTPMSVRAYFSYDPEEDLYIPCRELGLSFQKGDILHVINQDDPNWWQAYREGEDIYGLAGLIPSKSFQIQRETLKMTLFAEAQARHGGKKRRKHGANDKRKNGFPLSSIPGYSPYNNASSTLGPYPNNAYHNNNGTQHNDNRGGGGGSTANTQTYDKGFASSLCGADSLAVRLCIDSDCRRGRGKDSYLDNDEYECDEILTYEEVELYYPRPERKRPIVLIGPPDIGRHELRQKLMENFPERFTAAVPHTSRAQKFGEIDGQDYHFLNRQTFESDIMTGKFVEHGEFEKNLYGTSLAAIKRVVDSGKSCILNLHPQSLKILYHSDLMPYVVFVAPPNIEKLKIIQEKRGVFKKDEELAEIIEKAREIEDNFGHYFDMIIVNTDLNKTYAQLLEEINRIECEPQWVPKIWLHLYPSNENASQSSQINLQNPNDYPSRTFSGRHNFIP